MATMETQENNFKLPISITESGTLLKTFHTKDTYVDKDITVEINTPDATYKTINEGAVTATSNILANEYTTTANTGYAITATADGEVSDVIVGVKDAGFASAGDTVTIEGSSAIQASKTVYLKDGSIDAKDAISQAQGGNGVKLTSSASAPTNTDTFYISTIGGATASVAEEGWVDATNDEDVPAVKTSYYTIASASLNNTNGSVDEEEFETLTTPVLTEGGNLYITEGYIKNTKISLADLVPDNANITSENADKVYKTVKAYDKNGALIVGTMGDATLSEITATEVIANINTINPEYNEATDKFNISGAGSISGSTSVRIEQTGYAVAGTEQTGTIAGSATVSATLNKIGIGAEKSADGAVTPVIAKVQEDTTALSGEITTTKPSSGKYIAVNTAAVSGATTVTPNVAVAGYGDTENYTATPVTVIRGANAATEAYITIAEGTHSVQAGTNTIQNAEVSISAGVTASAGHNVNVLTSAPSGAYLTITGTEANHVAGTFSNTVTCTATEGYIEAGTKNATVSGTVDVNVSPATAKYIKIYEGDFN